MEHDDTRYFYPSLWLQHQNPFITKALDAQTNPQFASTVTNSLEGQLHIPYPVVEVGQTKVPLGVVGSEFRRDFEVRNGALQVPNRFEGLDAHVPHPRGPWALLKIGSQWLNIITGINRWW